MRIVMGLWDNVHEIIIEEIEFSHKKELDSKLQEKQPDEDKR